VGNEELLLSKCILKILFLSRRFVPLRKVPFRLESVLMGQQEGMENLTSANDYLMLDIVIIFSVESKFAECRR
jgi:hypothetical protein